MRSGISSEPPGEVSIPVYVVDSFAYFAFVRREPAYEVVGRLFAAARAGRAELHMSGVNAAEVLYLIWRREGEGVARRAIANLPLLGVTIHDATLDLCMQAAALKAEHPVALGDCFAASLARKLNATLVTGDPEFRKFGKLVKVKWL